MVLSCGSDFPSVYSPPIAVSANSHQFCEVFEVFISPPKVYLYAIGVHKRLRPTSSPIPVKLVSETASVLFLFTKSLKIRFIFVIFLFFGPIAVENVIHPRIFLQKPSENDPDRFSCAQPGICCIFSGFYSQTPPERWQQTLRSISTSVI